MISAKIVADSISNHGCRITTLELEYPRFIHSELMTHRVFSRGAASSRAISVDKSIDMVRHDTVVPDHWGMNTPGMSAKQEADNGTKAEGILAWIRGALRAIDTAEELKSLNLHKQVINRVLEPYVRMKTIVTSTEWDNFFELRIHPAAEPHFQDLARKIFSAMEKSVPRELKPGEWHLPYAEGIDDILEALLISVSCCAQVSYRNTDTTLEKAHRIAGKLFGPPLHASPFEHQAMVPRDAASVIWDDCPHPNEFEEGITHVDLRGNLWSGNLRNWIQLRQRRSAILDMMSGVDLSD